MVEPSSLTSCYSGGGAHCIPASVVPASFASMLASCPTGGGLCAPDTFIAAGGQFIPPTCVALESAEGRCLHLAIPQVAQQHQLTQSTCAAYERCVPCYNPIDGSLDPSFGGGKVHTDFAMTGEEIFGLALQPDGEIVAAGGTTAGGG